MTVVIDRHSSRPLSRACLRRPKAHAALLVGSKKEDPIVRTPIHLARLEAPPTQSAFFILILRGIAMTIKDWRRTRRSERELLALGDRNLADMGITRCEISNAVCGRHQNARSVDPFVSAATALRIPLSVVDIAPGEARDIYGTDLALVGPDQIVAWRGNRPVDPARVLRPATRHSE